MITAIYRMTVSPPIRDKQLGIIRLVSGPTRDEKGCRSVCLCRDTADENSFILLEEWESRDDLERHIRGRNFRKLLLMMDTLAESPKVSLCSDVREEGLKAIGEILDNNPKEPS